MKLYGVFQGDKFGMTRNKREAMRYAKEVGTADLPATVRAKEDIPEVRCYDAPTFWLLSDKVAQFPKV